MTSEALTLDRIARLLRAKAGELENIYATAGYYNEHFAAADIALIASLLAEVVERLSANDGTEAQDV